MRSCRKRQSGPDQVLPKQASARTCLQADRSRRVHPKGIRHRNSTGGGGYHRSLRCCWRSTKAADQRPKKWEDEQITSKFGHNVVFAPHLRPPTCKRCRNVAAKGLPPPDACMRCGPGSGPYRCTKCLKRSQYVQNVKKFPKMSQYTLKFLTMSQNCPKRSHNVPKHTNMSKDIQQYPKMSQNISKCPKTLKNVQKCPDSKR